MSTTTSSALLSHEPTAEVKGARPQRRYVIALVSAAVVAAGGGWYATSLGHESTDDAQIDAEVVAVPARTSGVVKKLDFIENQQVHAGDILAELDDDAPRAELAQAEAALVAAQAAADAADADDRVATTNAFGNKGAADASLVTAAAGALSANDQIREAEAGLQAAEASRLQAQSDKNRAISLSAAGALPKAALEQAETALSLAVSNANVARARLATLRTNVKLAAGRVAEAQARATQSGNTDALIAQAHARALSAHAEVAKVQAGRDLAALRLSYTRIVAPHDGVVSKKALAEGQNVQAGQAVVQLVTPGVWVSANFKETQLENMRVGQPVTLSVDAFPSATIRGEVESFSGGTGSRFTLLPPDNASGNFTKVVQRLPVRIRLTDIPSRVTLRPGMSVDVRVNTRG